MKIRIKNNERNEKKSIINYNEMNYSQTNRTYIVYWYPSHSQLVQCSLSTCTITLKIQQYKNILFFL